MPFSVVAKPEDDGPVKSVMMPILIEPLPFAGALLPLPALPEPAAAVVVAAPEVVSVAVDFFDELQADIAVTVATTAAAATRTLRRIRRSLSVLEQGATGQLLKISAHGQLNPGL